MKIYPNHAMNDMFKNGEARIVDSKFIPFRYLNTRITSENLRMTNVEREELADVGLKSASAFDDQSVDMLSSTTTETQIELINQVLLPNVQEAIDNTVEFTPEPQCVAEPITTIEESNISPEPEPEPEPELVVPMPQVSSEIATPTLAVWMEPVVVEAVQEAIPEQLPVILDSVVTVLLPETQPNVTVKVIQPESALGGLIAECSFVGDPSVTCFGENPGLIFDDPAMQIQINDESLEENPQYPPYVSFITFNRLGLTIKNLSNLLDSKEDFELNIIDCNSKDNSWDYIQSLTDRRIKSRIRFNTNVGPIFAINFALSRRKPFQYFFAMDSDTFIKTKNWIACFMEVFNAFPEVGLLGLMRDNPYPRYLPPVTPRANGTIAYLELKNADIEASMDFVPGQLQCLRPNLIKEIGFWSEENGFGDAEISPRIVHYTNFKVGYITTVEIDMTQRITCDECAGKDFCQLSRSVTDCFMLSRQFNKNESFVEKNTWKFKESFQELREGQRTAYCASIHDPVSMKTHKYNQDWAFDNFNHYIFNAN